MIRAEQSFEYQGEQVHTDGETDLSGLHLHLEKWKFLLCRRGLTNKSSKVHLTQPNKVLPCTARTHLLRINIGRSLQTSMTSSRRLHAAGNGAGSAAGNTASKVGKGQIGAESMETTRHLEQQNLLPHSPIQRRRTVRVREVYQDPTHLR